MTATCRSCQAPLWWVETVKGRRMPLDPEPCPDGNVVVAEVRYPGTSVERTLVQVIAGPVHPDRIRYRAHFATCPNAAQHRKRVPGGAE